ncbi:MAG: YdcF family protein [Burkholderiales bacterium]
MPPAAPLIVVAAGLWLARRQARAGRALAIAGLAGAWLLSAPLGAEALARLVEAGQRPLDASAWAVARDAARPPQAVVVLGAGIVPDRAAGPDRERLSARSLQRALAGARTARLTGLPVMVCGGRPRQTRESEAGLLRRVLESELGVPVRWSEDRSRDTIENAENAAAILEAAGVRHIVLVTHAHHMRRARAAFESAGFTVLPAPHDPLGGQRGDPGLSDLLPAAEAADVSSLATHELLGTLWQALRRPR